MKFYAQLTRVTELEQHAAAYRVGEVRRLDFTAASARYASMHLTIDKISLANRFLLDGAALCCSQRRAIAATVI